MVSGVVNTDDTPEENPEEQVHPVSLNILHEEYDNYWIFNDIAALKVRSRLPHTSWTKLHEHVLIIISNYCILERVVIMVVILTFNCQKTVIYAFKGYRTFYELIVV